jgi:DNA-binding transcriptional regulator YiaG
MNNLGDMFDYAVIDCGYEADEFLTHFITSGIADAFGKGNPKYVAGLSGPELASEVAYRTRKERLDIMPSENVDKSPEYWSGWVLAYYQWHSALRFLDLRKSGLTMKRILSLYPTIHEADLSKFAAVADHIVKVNTPDSASRLQRIRRANGLTQKKLAEKSGSSLRMIQLYEQRRQDINKAHAATISRIANVLGCRVEDLLD